MTTPITAKDKKEQLLYLREVLALAKGLPLRSRLLVKRLLRRLQEAVHTHTEAHERAKIEELEALQAAFDKATLNINKEIDTITKEQEKLERDIEVFLRKCEKLNEAIEAEQKAAHKEHGELLDVESKKKAEKIRAKLS